MVMDEVVRAALDGLVAAAATAATATGSGREAARAEERAAWLRAIETVQQHGATCESRGFRAGWREEARIQAQRAVRAARASRRGSK